MEAVPNKHANYRLDVRASSFYARQFRVRDLHYFPRIEAGFYVLQRGKYVRCDDLNSDRVYRQERREHGSVRISTHYGSFEIKLPSENLRVPPSALRCARELLLAVSEVDALCRDATDDTVDEGEVLGLIEMFDDHALFHYYASIWNNQWAHKINFRPDRFELEV